MRRVAQVLALWSALSAVAAAGEDTCSICHSNRELATVQADGRAQTLYVDPAAFAQSAHGQLGCDGCHAAMSAGPHGAVPEPQVGAIWQAILAPRRAAVRAAVAACITCHSGVADTFAGSIHAQAAARGNREVPLCHDCHGAHKITRKADLEGTGNQKGVTATCARCHADALKMARYNVKTNVVRTFDASFHGEKSMLGDRRAAICTSCHGVHDIRAPDDPASRVNPSNVASTCGACHQGADERFARSFKHQVPTGATAPLVFYVTWFYRLAITATIGGMLGYILLDMRRRRGRRSGHR